MRANAEKTRRPEEPFVIAPGNRDATTVDGGAQAEPSRVPVVGRPIYQRQEKEEKSRCAVLGHQADAELASLVIREQKIGRGKNEDEGPPHRAERLQKVGC